MRIEAQNLSMKYYDADRVIDVFHNLSLEIESAHSLAVVGESGVGKSTLLYLLGALESPTAGDVQIGGTSLYEGSLSASQRAKFRGMNIGFVFQFHYLLPEFDALENVAMPLVIQGVGFEQARERAAALLKRVGLEKRFSHRPGMLSGGEQQRVALARAFVAKPGVVLADEPTGSLDYKTSGDIASLLRELQAEHGITLLVVTHSLELARQMDRVMELTPEGLMDRGSLNGH